MSVLGCNFIEMARREGMGSAQCHKQLELQLHFLTEHLMKWIPDWANQVRDFSETDFYRALAGLTQTWIEADQRLLINSLHTHQNSSEDNLHRFPFRYKSGYSAPFS